MIEIHPSSSNSFTSHTVKRWVFSVLACVLCSGMSATTLLAQPGINTVPPVPEQADGSAKKAEEPKTKSKPMPFDGAKAWSHLQAVCSIGPRISTSPGMKQQQQYLEKHFQTTGGEWLTQEFIVQSPVNGIRVPLQNIMVRYNTDRKRRLMICCHHDTRPFPDQDKRNPRGVFIGANDGGSGVALLCELGRHLADMEGDWGVDLMFFDGEEFVIDRHHPMFLGSTYFAQQYAAGQIPWKYEYAVLVDMVADKDLQIYYEKNSLAPGPNGLTRSIWSTARRLGVKEFVPKARHIIKDDHVPLNNIARIPTCDIIDFDYPNPRKGNVYWHTTKDIIQNCSQDSLHKVGAVVLEWIREVQSMQQK